jgi:beta-galactosidase
MKTHVRQVIFAIFRRAAFCAALGCVVAAAAVAPRPLNDGWRFHLGDVPGAEAPSCPDAEWAVVDVPHAARLEARVTDKEARQQWEGICWYRKTFDVPTPPTGGVVWLRFEGAMNVADVFVNGVHRARSLDGYTPFVVDLTPEAGRRAVTVALRLDNRATEVTGPKPLPVLDFHLYHGLYREVSLIVKPALHITDEIMENRVASGGVFVTYPAASEQQATVATQVHLRNAGREPAKATVRTVLRELDGTRVGATESAPLELGAGDDRAVRLELAVERPRLWSPRSPHLYLLDAEIAIGGTVVDLQRQRIGIRRFQVGPGGITINGRTMWLRGVNRHQEYPYVGNAVPPNAQYRDALKIKQAGFDYVRLSHYPQSPAFLDACDELGLVVLDGILGWQFNPGTPAFMDNRVAAVRALVRRDRNHACALLWEPSLNESAMTPEFIARLQRAAHEEYPGDQMVTAGWLQGYDVKLTARQHGSTKEFAAATFPCVVSEYGDWEYYAGNAGFNQETWGNLQEAERNSRQSRGDGEVRLLQQATNLQEAHNENRGTQAFADGYWVMYDYNRGYAPDLETSGVMDLFRLPKFSHAFFQSQRDADDLLPGRAGGPMVTVASWWTPASPLNVRVFSNCEEVELALNGRSLGRRRPDGDRMSVHLAHPPFTFRVAAFEPGELHATGYRNGRVVAEDRVRTPGPAARVELKLDESGRPLSAGGDLVFLYARVVDANDTVVPTASTAVKFMVEGDATLIGDNPSAAEAGIAAILLRSGQRPGRVRITAEAGELRGSAEFVVR